MAGEQLIDVRQLVVQAVGRAYDDWAKEHPNLAGAIDRLSVTQRVAESLRASPEYRDALEAYARDRSQLAFLNRLIELAAPVLAALLAG
jgi:hypothetical protein